MKIIKTNFKNLKIIKLNCKFDKRGYFCRLLDDKFFKKKFKFDLKNINISLSKHKHTLRGLHYQKKPFQEDKIIFCLSGSIFDVALDLRKNSKTYNQYYSAKLKNNNIGIFIPKGFAHGFLTLESNCKVIYFVSNYYSKKSESIVNYSDKKYNIKWPFKPKNISKKDFLS